MPKTWIVEALLEIKKVFTKWYAIYNPTLKGVAVIKRSFEDNITVNLGDEQLPGKNIAINLSQSGITFVADNGLTDSDPVTKSYEWDDLYDVLCDEMTDFPEPIPMIDPVLLEKTQPHYRCLQCKQDFGIELPLPENEPLCSCSNDNPIWTGNADGLVLRDDQSFVNVWIVTFLPKEAPAVLAGTRWFLTREASIAFKDAHLSNWQYYSTAHLPVAITPGIKNVYHLDCEIDLIMSKAQGTVKEMFPDPLGR